MRKDNWPTQEQINDSINRIIDLGLEEIHSFRKFSCMELIKKIGIRGLFPNLSTTITIIILMAALYGLSVYRCHDDMQMIRTVFSFSPLIFMCVMLANGEYMKKSNMLEVELICKLNLFKLSAIRMFLISIASMVVNTCMIVFSRFVVYGIDVFYVASVSNSSLFIVSFCMIVYSTKKVQGRSMVLFPVIWIVLNVFLCETWLYRTAVINGSQILHWTVTTVVFLLYLRQLHGLTRHAYTMEGIKIC